MMQRRLLIPLHSELPQQTVTPETEVPPQEPSPYVEAVADEPAAALVDEPALAPVAEPPPPAVERSAPAAGHQGAVMARRAAAEYAPVAAALAMRGRWIMRSPLLARLGRIHPPDRRAHLAAGFGRLWSDIAAAFGLDPDGRVMKAFATRDTWSGILR